MYDSLEERVLLLEDRYLRLNLSHNTYKDYDSIITALDTKLMQMGKDLTTYADEKEKLMNCKLDRLTSLQETEEVSDFKLLEDRISLEILKTQTEIDSLNEKYINTEKVCSSLSQDLMVRLEAIEQNLKQLNHRQDTSLNVEISKSLQRLSNLNRLESERSEAEIDPITRQSTPITTRSKSLKKKKLIRKKPKSTTVAKRRTSLSKF